jgi:hypothetical protein
MRKYSHSTWHFVDWPVVLGSTAPPPKPNDDNLLTAIDRAYHLVKAPNSSKEDRAVYLCWLLNLTVEIHKPTHVATLYSRRFAQGDKGANLLRLENGQTLHSVWCGDEKFAADLHLLELRASELTGGGDLGEGEHVGPPYDWGKWASESFEIAKRDVYDQEVLELVSAQEADPAAKLRPLKLSGAYFATAGRVATTRTMRCSVRLASLITDSVTPQQ